MPFKNQNKKRTLLASLGVLPMAALTIVACSSGTRVPVHSGVAALHAEEHPTCADLSASTGPMGISKIAHVQIMACGVRTDYICNVDTLPAQDLVAHTKARCARSDSLRGAAMRTLDRSQQPNQNTRQQPRVVPRHPPIRHERIPPRSAPSK